MGSKTDPIKEASLNKDFDMYRAESTAKIHFACYIYKRRKELGMNQSELARKAETTQKIISKIENTNYNAGMDLVARIKYILNKEE